MALCVEEKQWKSRKFFVLKRKLTVKICCGKIITKLWIFWVSQEGNATKTPTYIITATISGGFHGWTPSCKKTHTHSHTHSFIHSFIIDQFLSAVLCLSASSFLSASSLLLLVLLLSGVGGEWLAAVVDGGAGEVHFDGEDIGLLQDGVALVIIMWHARDEALQLEHNVLDCRGRRWEGKELIYVFSVFLVVLCQYENITLRLSWPKLK